VHSHYAQRYSSKVFPKSYSFTCRHEIPAITQDGIYSFDFDDMGIIAARPGTS